MFKFDGNCLLTFCATFGVFGSGGGNPNVENLESPSLRFKLIFKIKFPNFTLTHGVVHFRIPMKCLNKGHLIKPIDGRLL